MPDTGVGLMARLPELGRVKTRLAANIGQAGALTVYKKLLHYSVGELSSLPKGDFLRSAFVTPPEQFARFHTDFPELDRTYGQVGDDLGDRMFDAVSVLLSVKGLSKALIVGTDLPQLTASLIMEAHNSLSIADLVLGPTTDGGYYLIGMRHPHKELFTDIAWSTQSVLQETQTIAKRLGLRCSMLQELSDVDTIEDLQQFPELNWVSKNSL